MGPGIASALFFHAGYLLKFCLLEQEQQRAEQERQHAKQANQRVEHLAVRLRALGIEPDE